MKCSEIQSKLSLYADDMLDSLESAGVDEHMFACPLCREQLDDIRRLTDDLHKMGRAAVPVGVSNRIRLAVRDELSSGGPTFLPGATVDWIRMRIMPFGVGVVATLVIGLSFLNMMFQGAQTAGDIIASDRGRDTRIMIATSGPGDADSISATEYAQARVAVAGESPSINPQGALIALTRSLMNGKMGNDEVVVVANVFSNGLAQITEVVEPSQNGRAIDELEKALESNAENAPFVPAVLDNRSENIRVVLKFQTVDVKTNSVKRKR